jgi:hypothetical protein
VTILPEIAANLPERDLHDVKNSDPRSCGRWRNAAILPEWTRFTLRAICMM